MTASAKWGLLVCVFLSLLLLRDNSAGGLGFAAPLFLGVVLILYFAPTIIACQRQKANLVSIFALNFLTGWTFIGWVIALVWALAVDRPAGAR